MRTLKSKFVMLTLSLIGVVAMSFALVNKEIPEAKTEAKASFQWRYIGTAEPGVYSNAQNWELGASTTPGCGPNGAIPCQLTADAEDRDELQDHLENLSNEQVLLISDTKRN